MSMEEVGHRIAELERRSDRLERVLLSAMDGRVHPVPFARVEIESLVAERTARIDAMGHAGAKNGGKR